MERMPDWIIGWARMVFQTCEIMIVINTIIRDLST
jgi:hypothetical protein